MKRHILFSMFIASALSACSTLPNAGPMANRVRSTPDATIIKVTPTLSESLEAISAAKDAKIEQQAVMNLRNSANSATDAVLKPGDSIKITVWSISPIPGKSSAASSPNGPSGTEIGTFSLNAAGVIELPYAGRVNLNNKTFIQAQNAIAQRYQAGGILQAPQATIELAEKSAQGMNNGIMISGAVGKPSVLPWTSGGMDLGKAITMAMGDGNTLFSAPEKNDDRNAITVDVHRNGVTTQLPMKTALEQPVPLQQGDRVIVHKASTIEVSVLGGGINRSGTYGFAETPTLAQVLGQAQGANTNTANSKALFVFHREDDGRFTIYDFSWNEGASLISAQIFPVHNGDLVYAPESAIVPITRVMNMIFTLMIPASMARP